MRISKTGLLASILLLSTAIAQAQVVNGDFENWSGSSPDNWTTIDSGISLAESASPTYTGNAAAAVTVSTGTQSSTDFRQSISVESGQSYNFSVWVYHTEGSVAARMYADGYHNYSNPALTGQWQQLSYLYTAAATGTIEIGLRFYDQSGFDGSEVVYIDNFTPSSGGGLGSGCNENSGQFSLTTDNYGAETSWQITDATSQVIFSGDSYASNASYDEAVCLADGDYTLTVLDSYGDGICCSHGNGSYKLAVENTTIASGGSFGLQENTNFTLGSGSGGGGNPDLSAYYQSASGLTGYSLKTELHNIIKNHSTQSYGDLWTFYLSHERDTYYENDGTILDIYSENPAAGDSYVFAAGTDQCGTYRGESDCYNREHAFPRSWFGGAIAPMNTDVHHIFATDGYVNSKRSSYPYGDVGSASYTSANGSTLGAAQNGLGYSGTVFEPIDEFKGDIARAYFYMATRYENVIAAWDGNSTYANAALNGTSNQVFETWLVDMLIAWHLQDPVSQKEIDRNEAAFQFQNNRNPFVDYPEFVNDIWGN
ncbi:endonuclease [Alteromonas ponticola]|uniref:Endonuclease I n=1 Tax=Alteromonas ponticola TaxID=2720613 RepID=A0ABX1R0D1_9ALTE|nr:endonuclease [Alteromonas ponticola]NMH59924.1 endonuclease I [Alteromonas ponticola]